jgi:hypothetical protein
MGSDYTESKKNMFAAHIEDYNNIKLFSWKELRKEQADCVEQFSK